VTFPNAGQARVLPRNYWADAGPARVVSSYIRGHFTFGYWWSHVHWCSGATHAVRAVHAVEAPGGRVADGWGPGGEARHEYAAAGVPGGVVPCRVRAWGVDSEA
jgi:hypothetical protein